MSPKAKGNLLEIKWDRTLLNSKHEYCMLQAAGLVALLLHKNLFSSVYFWY